MKDIASRDDINLIMRLFYKKLLQDERINYLFTEVAQLDLESHFEILNDFWESILFGTAQYQRNAMLKHIELNQKSPLLDHHFDIWLAYLSQTIADNYQGEKASEMFERANQIAQLMRFKVKN